MVSVPCGQCPQQRSSSSVPDQDVSVVASGGQQMASGLECQRESGVLVPSQQPDRPAGRRIPETDRTVLARGGNGIGRRGCISRRSRSRTRSLMLRGPWRSGRDGTALSDSATPIRAEAGDNHRAGARLDRCCWPTTRVRPAPCGGSRGSLSARCRSWSAAWRAASVARNSCSSRRW